MTTEDRTIPMLSWSQVLARRLERHALTATDPAYSPEEAVRRTCGAHAQIMSAAELSIGIRTVGVNRRDVQDALWTKRDLVKTYGPRGTVHLLAATDLPMWTSALAAVPAHQDGLPPALRLDSEQTDELVSAIGIALADAELTIDELGERVITVAGAWAGALVIPAFNGLWPRWRRALMPAANRGILCFGPDRGRNVTYTSPKRWLAGFQLTKPDVAIADLVRHYLAAYGPATSAQFAQWLAAPRRWATELFGRLGPSLTEVEVEGARAWLPSGDTGAPTRPPQGVRLLPYFDAYAVGCHPRDQVFPGPAAQRALARGQAGNVPVMIIDGVVGGVWHQRRSGRTIDIRVEPFDPLDRNQRLELDEQVQRLGQVLAGEPVLTIGTVGSGRHL